ncbi:molecular chaperone [Stenotrophomonas maltophilia]|uniref:fimbrial biogenesis chaperone n=1 Tax=Stenotrophomonas maltophilia TaxID=40324 RepID=UPI0011107881|nr:fimbria/pilus periplasmic chaperone [Stenotrophomonas maltophilia]TIK68119.1 molecular chaperone [Stenotrophomonas maltophilia]TIK75582.1 molecular chaperone [Stenotrophomonas maltophilia]
MRCLHIFTPVAFAIAGMAGIDSAAAGVTLGATRIVYPEQAREVSIRLNNDGDIPSLVQTWIDDGDINATPSTASAPFTIRPPIFRVEGGKAQVLRIQAVGGQFPKDRESLFWFNSRDVPAAAAGEDRSQLHVIVRTRIKLFYRPSGLSAAGAAKAPGQLIWTVTKGSSGQILEARNPTLYHVNLNRISVGGGDLDIESGVVAPLASVQYRLTDSQHRSLGDQVTYEFVNDQGGQIELKAPLN